MARLANCRAATNTAPALAQRQLLAENFSVSQGELFANELPEGFIYRAEFITAEEERVLIAAIDELAFAEIRMHGVVAKRRAAHFGFSYQYGTGKIAPGAAIPEFLEPLRQRVAHFAASAADEFAEVLVTDYPTGAGIGWHRDAPPFDIIAGVSLLASCTMQLRPWPPERATPGRSKLLSQILEPRSAYILCGASRTSWQHRLAPINTRRVSITFRTLRRSAAGRALHRLIGGH